MQTYEKQIPMQHAHKMKKKTNFPVFTFYLTKSRALTALSRYWRLVTVIYHPSMGVRMKQTARIHHRKATSFFFLSGPGIVSLASSLILVNKPTGLNRKKKHPQGHNDFSTWLYTLFQLGKEFLHINNLIPCLKSTEP